MTMQGHSIYPKAPRNEPHHRMRLSITPKMFFVYVLTNQIRISTWKEIAFPLLGFEYPCVLSTWKGVAFLFLGLEYLCVLSTWKGGSVSFSSFRISMCSIHVETGSVSFSWFRISMCNINVNRGSVSFSWFCISLQSISYITIFRNTCYVFISRWSCLSHLSSSLYPSIISSLSSCVALSMSNFRYHFVGSSFLSIPCSKPNYFLFGFGMT